MSTPIPMLDLMFFLTESVENPRHVGSVLIFQPPRRGGAEYRARNRRGLSARRTAAALQPHPGVPQDRDAALAGGRAHRPPPPRAAPRAAGAGQRPAAARADRRPARPDARAPSPGLEDVRHRGARRRPLRHLPQGPPRAGRRRIRHGDPAPLAGRFAARPAHPDHGRPRAPAAAAAGTARAARDARTRGAEAGAQDAHGRAQLVPDRGRGARGPARLLAATQARIHRAADADERADLERARHRAHRAAAAAHEGRGPCRRRDAQRRRARASSTRASTATCARQGVCRTTRWSRSARCRCTIRRRSR